MFLRRIDKHSFRHNSTMSDRELQGKEVDKVCMKMRIEQEVVEMENIWDELESKLLHAANTLLSQDTVPSKENLDTVSQLLDLAVRIDSLNLEWEVQNQERRAYNVPKIKDRDVCK